MLNWIWMGMIVVGVFVGALLGRLEGPDGVVEGLFIAVRTGVVGIVIPLSAIMMLWLGVMRLAEKSGIVYSIATFVRPVMRRLFPEVPPEHPAMGAMVMNMAANFLGLGNAATPLGLKAMQHLNDLNPEKGTATNSMCTFLAINTSSVTLIPATAIGLLAAQGISQPYAIVGTTVAATLCSTIVAILAVKTFERMPMFNKPSVLSADERAEAEAAAVLSAEKARAGGLLAEEKAGDREGEMTARQPLSRKSRMLLALVALLFVGVVALETSPGLRPALQETLGLNSLVADLDGGGEAVAGGAAAIAAEDLDAQVEEAVDPLWRRLLSALSLAAIPFVLVFFTLYAALKRVPVYEEFVEGAKEGWQVAVRIMPFIVAMLAALAILRNSGTLAIIQNLLRPVLELVRFPVELVPMALMRPLSGSGSQGVLVEILTNEGISEAIKYAAATMYGSTETTFYVLAVYFGSVAVRRTRHALAAGLCADFAGVVAAVAICAAMFG